MPKKSRTFNGCKSFCFVVLYIFSASFIQCGCAPGNIDHSEFSKTVLLMGTFVQVKIVNLSEDETKILETIDEVFELAGHLERRLSIFSPESELNDLNFNRSIKASPELLGVIYAAKAANIMTYGAFDPTVVPILKRNGFYKEMPQDILRRIPDDDSGIGFDNVQIDDVTGVVSLNGSSWLDLSGIAKGYIVDQMAVFLKEKGIESFLVNAGGDIYCGSGPRGKKWTIGVRKPGTKDVAAILELEDKAVVTSGDYENFVQEPGSSRKISHIVDPGLKSSKEMVTLGITVLSRDCVTADGLATGMLVMGPEKAVEIVESVEGVEVIAVLGSAGKQSILLSTGAHKYLRGESIK